MCSIGTADSSTRFTVRRQAADMTIALAAAVAPVGCGTDESSEYYERCLPHGAIGARCTAIGSMFWTEQTGAGAVYGELGVEYADLGGPTSDEYDVPVGRQTDFQGGWIRWIADTGEVVTVNGALQL